MAFEDGQKSEKSIRPLIIICACAVYTPNLVSHAHAYVQSSKFKVITCTTRRALAYNYKIKH